MLISYSYLRMYEYKRRIKHHGYVLSYSLSFCNGEIEGISSNIPKHLSYNVVSYGV